MLNNMNDNEKKELERLVKENDTKDFTESIRERKHSTILRQDILRFYKLKYDNPIKVSEEELRKATINQCEFLYKNYREIFEIVLTKDMNLSLMMRLLEILEKIENKELNQHEGSFLLGNILKSIYVDTKLEETEGEYDKSEINETMNLSWNEFKRMNK